MANHVETLNYGLYFANPAQGLAAKAANGGTIALAMTPDQALSTFSGSQYVNLGPPYFSSVPGTFDLGTISGSITPSTNGMLRTPHLLSSGTLRTTVHEVSYLNGVVQTDVLVDYVWSGAMMFDAGVPPLTPVPGVPTGKFESTVVFWTGDGTGSKLIPTPFPLDTGKVAIWGCGGIDKTGGSEANFFRHNGPLMTGTALCGFASGLQVAGITGFSAAGFTVSAGSFVFTFGNTLNTKYAAVVLRDTTSNNRFLQIGNYTGVMGGQVQANVVHGSVAITRAGGIPWTPGMFLTVQDGTGTYTFLALTSSTAQLTPGYLGFGTLTFFVIIGAQAGDQRVIPTDGSGILTHLWVWGGTTSYKSPELAGATSVSLLSGASGVHPDSTHITALSSTFTVTDGCNALNTLYSYMGLCADAEFLAGLFFKSFGGVSNGGSQTLGGIGFTPSLAFARQGSPIFTDGAFWRASTQAITPSTSLRCAIVGGVVSNDTNGITAIPAGSVTLGAVAQGLVVGDPFYVWAWAGGSTPGEALIPVALLPIPTLPADPGLSPNPNPPGSPGGPGTPPTDPGPPIPPPTPGGVGNCPPCPTLTYVLGILASRLQDVGMVHWTQAELTRYLTEALRTWNALTGDDVAQGTFAPTLGVPFYDLPTIFPAFRAYTVTDTYLVSDLEYALMEAPTPTAWTGTLQFTFADLVSALQTRRDQFLVETGMVVTRVIQALAVPPISGRVPLHPSILTVRRLAFIDAIGAAYPLQRDDEWGGASYTRLWPTVSGVPLATFPIAYSMALTAPWTVQILPPLSTAGTLDLLAVTRAAVMGGTGPCLDPATGILLGIPDDWTWVVKWGALATLLSQQGVTYDPQRAAYCEARFRHGVLLATQNAIVLAARINNVPAPITSVSEADQYTRSWQRLVGTPASVLLAGQALVGLAPPPATGADLITLDLVRNMTLPVLGTDCLDLPSEVLEPILGYAQHLALFKEGPTQLQQSMGLLDSFFRATGINTSLEFATSPTKPVLLDQTRSDERQLPRLTTPPPIQITAPGASDSTGGS